MKNIVVISLILASILLSSIILTSICNVKKFIVSTELAEEEETRTKNRSNSNTLNLTEEEEQHGNEIYRQFPEFIEISTLKPFYLNSYFNSVFIDIVTPPPLG
ncbi:MAG: hypothetical protein H6589_01565 [Flavobacteriales bacterium]|nr:hypothetical protein [Flavobacteriales bacterium]